MTDISPHARLDFRATKVIAWMFGALASFMLAAVSIRELSKSLNVFEINVCRTGGGLIVLIAALSVSKPRRSGLSAIDIPKHLFRNVVHAAGGFFWTLAISALPLATVFSLEFTAPAWTALMSLSVLGERVRTSVVIGLIASFVGTLIILRPAPGSFDAMAIFPLAAGMCLGLSALLTRRLTRNFEIFTILFWMMVIQLTINTVGVFVFGYTPMFNGNIPERVVIAAIILALAGLSSQLCLSNALKIGEANMVMPLDFLRVPLIAGIGAVFYDEPFDCWVMVGAAVIAAGIVVGLPRSGAPRLAAPQPGVS